MSNETCALLATEFGRFLVDKIEYASFFYIKPICLVFDLAGRILFFLAFYHEVKSDEGDGYKFQLYESIARTVNTLLELINLIVLHGQQVHGGSAWYQQSYVLSWYGAHVSIPLLDMSATIAMFISLATSIDRCYAISHPLEYQQMNRKKWETIALSVSILIGSLTSIFVCFFFKVQAEKKHYSVVWNSEFMSSLLAAILGHVRNVIWIGGLIAIMVCGFRLVHLYRKRNRQVAHMTLASSEDTLEKRRRKSEKTLFILTVYESVQATNEIGVFIAHTMMDYKSGFYECENRLFTAFRNIEISLVNASDFYILFLVNRSFRKLVKRSLQKD